MAHSIIDSKDATGLRSDGTHDTTETDHYVEGIVEDFMRKGYKGGVRTRDFHPVTARGCGREGGKVPGGRSAMIVCPVSIVDGKVIRD